MPFLHASGSEFVEKYVGVGARRVRDLFAQARKLGRGVIFFDEFDALGKARGGPEQPRGARADAQPAARRARRLRHVERRSWSSPRRTGSTSSMRRCSARAASAARSMSGCPTWRGRRAILEVHARSKPLAPAADLEALARKTYGFSGRAAGRPPQRGGDHGRAARRPTRSSPRTCTPAGSRSRSGTRRRRSMDERERAIIAAHEVGHAICGRVHGDKRRVEEISPVRPRRGPRRDRSAARRTTTSRPRRDLRARLVALMGGRAAEELLFQEVTRRRGERLREGDRDRDRDGQPVGHGP